MPDNVKYLSKLTLIDGTVVFIKDAEARAAIAGGTHFIGITETTITDGDYTNPIYINDEEVAVSNGDIVIYGNKEFIYAEIDTAWHELGDISNLGTLAAKDTATGSYTPFGSVTFTGDTIESTGTYTPSGSVSKPDVDITKTFGTVVDFDSPGSVRGGTSASLDMTYNSITEDLAVSFTPNTPTSVTLPTSRQTSVLINVAAELHEEPTFTGDEAEIEVEGTTAGSAEFVGEPSTIIVS